MCQGKTLYYHETYWRCLFDWLIKSHDREIRWVGKKDPFWSARQSECDAPPTAPQAVRRLTTILSDPPLSATSRPDGVGDIGEKKTTVEPALTATCSRRKPVLTVTTYWLPCYVFLNFLSCPVRPPVQEGHFFTDLEWSWRPHQISLTNKRFVG